jgi:hypothetical protein
MTCQEREPGTGFPGELTDSAIFDKSGIAGMRLAEPGSLLRGIFIRGIIKDTNREDKRKYLLALKKVSFLKKAK